MNNPKTWFALSLAAVVAVACAAVSPGSNEANAQDAAQSAPKPDAAKPRDFSGKYLAEGSNNGGRNYKAMVEISREGDVYQVLWVLGPREAYMGVGLIEGDALCVGWATGQVPGLVVYKPGTDGKLVGRWTAPGSEGKTFKETLSPVK